MQKKKLLHQFSIWWQSKKFRFIAAGFVLIFITAIGSIQTAWQIAIISDHQLLCSSSTAVLKSVSYIGVAAAKENSLILQLKNLRLFSEENQKRLVQSVEKNKPDITANVSQEIYQTEKLVFDLDESCSAQFISGLTSTRIAHQSVATNLNTYLLLIQQQRFEDAKKMYQVTKGSSVQLLKIIKDFEQRITAVHRISSKRASVATNTLSWFSCLGWGCTALITFFLITASDVKEIHSKMRTKLKNRQSKDNKKVVLRANQVHSQSISVSTKEKKDYDLTDSHILVAEDGTHNRRLLQTILEKRGAIVYAFENGKEVVDFFATENGSQIEILLLDILMPVMDGIEAATLLRNDGCQLPMVAVTATDDNDENRQKYKVAGFDEYLQKPFDKNELLTLVGDLLNRNLKPATT